MSLKALRVLFVALVTSKCLPNVSFKIIKPNVYVMRAWAYDNVFVVCLCIYECEAHVTWHACGCQGQQQVLVLIFSLAMAQGMAHCFPDAVWARLAGPWVMCTASISSFLMWIWDIQAQVVRLAWQALYHSEPRPQVPVYILTLNQFGEKHRLNQCWAQ